ncbi:MAG: metallophosphoesterase family protein [Bacteroidales bacterium]|nr:metallophosphoesterase family protein [Bacteroidales bacterium]MBR5092080.1 metallophosphoesterase family protein [Bacteroidales bacterium]
MKRIGVLSDTHGVVAPQVYTFFKDCDELWHAGDLGPGVLEELRAWKTVRAVYGNCDSFALHYELEEQLFFEVEGLRVLMMHIGGWPGHYPVALRRTLELSRPDLFVCGHSHILKVMYDKDYNFLHINPGAAGRSGFHKSCTLVRFALNPQPCELEIMDFPKFPEADTAR